MLASLSQCLKTIGTGPAKVETIELMMLLNFEMSSEAPLITTRIRLFPDEHQRQQKSKNVSAKALPTCRNASADVLPKLKYVRVGRKDFYRRHLLCLGRSLKNRLLVMCVGRSPFCRRYLIDVD